MQAILVSLGYDHEKLKETQALAETMDYNIIKTFIQKKKERPTFLIGRGKVEEIKEFVNENEVDLIIFENFLAASQILALENTLRKPIIDKFDLILNVFELRAHTKEAKLQTELARLNRKLPYIKMVLGIKVKEEHPGFGGSGEFIIHSTITGIRKKIKKMEQQIEKFEVRIEKQRNRRKKIGKIVSLAGYTNAGKTTLLNTLSGTEKDVKNELFTTLSTKTSRIGKKIFINDTIGFLRDLPHELIVAFRATLSSIKDSDLILVILDASESKEEFSKKLRLCEDTLNEIGAVKMPRFYVLNKIDKINKKRIEFFLEIIPDAILISALENIGLKELNQKISDFINDFN